MTPESAKQIERAVVRDKFRFAVRGLNDRHSGVWVAFGNRNDFYLGVRTLFGSMKISLHGSGRSRVAYTEEFARHLIERGILPASQDRAFIKWDRPPTPETGTFQAASLMLPLNHLALDPPKSNTRRPIAVIDALTRDKAIEFGFFFSRDPIAQLEARFVRSKAMPLVYSTLDSGETVSTVVRLTNFDPASVPTPEDLKSPDKIVLNWTNASAPGRTAKNCNVVLWNKPSAEGGVLKMMEIGGVTVTRDK